MIQKCFICKHFMYMFDMIGLQFCYTFFHSVHVLFFGFIHVCVCVCNQMLSKVKQFNHQLLASNRYVMVCHSHKRSNKNCTFQRHQNSSEVIKGVKPELTHNSHQLPVIRIITKINNIQHFLFNRYLFKNMNEIKTKYLLIDSIVFKQKWFYTLLLRFIIASN